MHFRHDNKQKYNNKYYPSRSRVYLYPQCFRLLLYTNNRSLGPPFVFLDGRTVFQAEPKEWQDTLIRFVTQDQRRISEVIFEYKTTLEEDGARDQRNRNAFLRSPIQNTKSIFGIKDPNAVNDERNSWEEIYGPDLLFMLPYKGVRSKKLDYYGQISDPNDTRRVSMPAPDMSGSAVYFNARKYSFSSIRAIGHREVIFCNVCEVTIGPNGPEPKGAPSAHTVIR